ncbi:MAG TPA: bifunctional helix-turn-helix domain-containing protein/methylated-DNA--[protein]-cysteine S-methyltransferase [Thermodesulfovibrionales bacterium]|nr:bifunctional helix-turn-helix domain-containing protein/methylated-DNA--[protein]-cysteine S-methyltransferase [Thermodesulfovibrionales bacterium]
MPSVSKNYRRIEKAILYLERNFRRQPSLRDIAASANLSEHHFQRLFRRWAGITPKKFLQLLTLESTKKLMVNAGSLLDVTYESGLSSPSRLHDLFVNVEAMTPDEFRNRGAGMKILYGFHPSPFGECYIAVTGRGICNLAFISACGRKGAVSDLRKRWDRAEIVEDSSATKPYADKIFGSTKSKATITLYLKGTNLQIKVWQALLNIPRGRLTSYKAIASKIGKSEATRAVANAIAHNPVAFLIPCHRVIRKTGVIGGYHWGSARKKAILAWEAGREEAEAFVADLDPRA